MTRLLVVTGLPGAGKTTAACALAQRYSAPLLGKDLIKEPLLDVLGAGDRTQSRLLSTASFEVLFACARPLLSARIDLIVEGNFRPGEHEPPLRALPARFAQILCRTGHAERLGRLARRRENPQRHPGHRDHELQNADSSGDAFLDLPGERFVLDTHEADTAGRDRVFAAVDRWWRGED